MSNELEVMVRDRGEGKTTETILWLLRSPLDKEGHPTRILLCSSDRRRDHVVQEYPALKGFVFTTHSWRGGRGMGRDIEVAIDDAEQFIHEIAPYSNITRITMTGKSI